MASTSSTSLPGVAFVHFPDAQYTQRAALRAAQAALEPQGWRVVSPQDEEDGDALRTAPKTEEEASAWIDRVMAGQLKTHDHVKRIALFMDYDLIPWDLVQGRGYIAASSTSTASEPSLTCVPVSSSSYCIRKSLIRKNWLHNSVHAHSVKSSASPSPLTLLPRTWSIDLQFADDLDELLIDELYDLAELLEQGQEERRRWFILKAAMADRGMGIRIFSSLDGLRRILEEFEEQDESEDEEEDEAAKSSSSSSAVALGQLRHFVIQEYISSPLLIAPPPSTSSATPPLRKFHLRAYVICVGGLSVYLCDEMLALFAPRKYSLPPHDDDDDDAERDTTGCDIDTRVHLTNTCLHAQEGDEETGQGNVHLLSRLCDEDASCVLPPTASCSSSSSSTPPPRPLTSPDLAHIRQLAATTIGAVFSSAARGAGATGWQCWDQAWEVFGVDLLVGRDVEAAEGSDAWRMWLLEVNAQPDFAQSGEELQSVVEKALKRAVEVGVLRREDEGWKVGQSRDGITLCHSEKMRGAW